ncbi:hypothetical protein PHYPO_G00186650 [Pangasianodon hypophthalmus]|uniref:Uncharacterized protein n=1 Tax=Pangasianodon hypophthalmus TaxID=310915 RepID=A0A5N5JGP0_PANHP|nr:hypothetical protein PHYPO_G00186650 [Pangasianodon hypophthalmus]
MWAETTTKKFSSTKDTEAHRFTVDFKFPSFKRLFLEEEEQEEGRRRRRGRRGRRGRVEVPGNNATMVVVWE